nr:hypothetical protein [uncultured bacterium]
MPLDIRSPVGAVQTQDAVAGAERPARFYAPSAAVPGERVLLPADESEHLARVLRLTTGDRVRVFNGRGSEFHAVVDSVARSGVGVILGEPCRSAPEPCVAVTLAQAVLKGDKMDEVVRDAVMIGAMALLPLITARTGTSMAALARSRRRERWGRIAVSSAKQCGRAVVPVIAEPMVFDGDALRAHDPAAAVFALVEPHAQAGQPLGSLDAAAIGPRATLVVGPEGGWSEEEIAALSTIGTLVTLGGRTLRADAMALVALAALFAKCGEY